MFEYVNSWSKLKDYYVVFYAFIPCYEMWRAWYQSWWKKSHVYTHHKRPTT